MISGPALLGQPARFITGTIEDFANGRVILFEALSRDTIAQGDISDHHFQLIPQKGEVAGQALPAMIFCLKDDHTQSTAAPIGIEDAEIQIALSGAGSNVYTGTALQEGFSTMLQNLREAELRMNAVSDDNTMDSIQYAIASHVESFYLNTRGTKFNTFMALIMLDFLDRKFVKAEDIKRVSAFCAENTLKESLDQAVCEYLQQKDMGWIGKKPPECSGLTVNGQSVKLSDIIGSKPVILDFWASWCGPCVKEMPELKELYSEGKVEILGVSIDSQRLPWEKALERLKLPWINILDVDQQIARDFHVISVPTKLVINKEGIIIALNPEDIRSVLEALY